MARRNNTSFPRAPIVSIFLCAFFSVPVWADESQDISTDDLAAAAADVYDELLRDTQDKDLLSASDVEQLGEWSRKIVASRTTGSDEWTFVQQELLLGNPRPPIGDPEAMSREWDAASEEHLKRMEIVQQLVHRFHTSGKASRSAVLAAAYYQLEARKLRERLDEGREIARSLAPQIIDVPKTREADLFVQVDGEGKITFDGKPCTLEDLETRLRREVESRAERVLEIRADRKAQFKQVRKVAQAANRAGIDHVQFSVRAEPAPPGLNESPTR